MAALGESIGVAQSRNNLYLGISVGLQKHDGDDLFTAQKIGALIQPSKGGQVKESLIQTGTRGMTNPEVFRQFHHRRPRQLPHRRPANL